MAHANDAPRFSIGELAQATGVSRRTIRYYVQLGLVAPPKGAGRGHYYERQHLETLMRIRELRDRGRSLEQVRSALEGGGEDVRVPPVELVARVRLAEGVDLMIGPGGRPPTARQIQEIAEAAARILGAPTTMSDQDLTEPDKQREVDDD